MAERPRARLHAPGRDEARTGLQGRPPRRQDPRPAQGLTPASSSASASSGRTWKSTSTGSSPRTRTGRSPRSCAATSSRPTPRRSVLVEKVLTAEQGGRTLTIEWSHAPGARPRLRRPRHRARRGGFGGRPGMGRRAHPGRQSRPPGVRGPGQGRVQGRVRRARARRDPPRPGALLRRLGRGPEPQRTPRRRGPPAHFRDRGQRRPRLLQPGARRERRRPGPLRHPQPARSPPGRGPGPADHLRVHPASRSVSWAGASSCRAGTG
ncbi:MAG: hypothetical protein MZV64_12860 [Ignavibacteriales bacterium]|nr:hypothetical protein [Ignavibacteriales bacterium]